MKHHTFLNQKPPDMWIIYQITMKLTFEQGSYIGNSINVQDSQSGNFSFLIHTNLKEQLHKAIYTIELVKGFSIETALKSVLHHLALEKNSHAAHGIEGVLSMVYCNLQKQQPSIEDYFDDLLNNVEEWRLKSFLKKMRDLKSNCTTNEQEDFIRHGIFNAQRIMKEKFPDNILVA